MRLSALLLLLLPGGDGTHPASAITLVLEALVLELALGLSLGLVLVLAAVRVCRAGGEAAHAEVLVEGGAQAERVEDRVLLQLLQRVLL